MKYQAILFDMDGTLLPMDEELFLKVYLGELGKEMLPYGVQPQQITPAMWKGVGAMVKNDGSRTNEEAFWQVFKALTPGADHAGLRPVTERFYTEGFHKARVSTTENPLAVRAVQLAHQKAPVVVLATNPLFPMAAQQTRMGWVGLQPADFDKVTAYESQRFCKPNPAYYAAICEELDLDPAACLMIGNDETEDMQAASALGMSGYLITDCLKPSRSEDYHWNGPRGSFAEMVAWLEQQ